MKNSSVFQTASEVRFYKVLKYIIPTYLTSLFNTLYTIVDGIFVSNYVGTNALAAINIVYPIVNVLFGIALVFATGGSAISALAIGAGNSKKADQAFSVSMLFSILLGCCISGIVFFNLTPVLSLLGATPVTMNDCRTYLLIWLVGTPAVIGKELFTYFIRVDGAPAYSFVTALSGGILNIILDYIFIGKLHMGILGAGLATILGLVLSLLLGVFYFLRRNKNLHFTLHCFRIKLGFYCMINGASEFINQLAIAVTTIVFNRTAMMLAGEDGIAAVSIIMYLQFIFIGIYFGFSMGISPMLSYAYGNGNSAVCRKLEVYSYRFFSIAPGLVYAITFFCAPLGVLFFAERSSMVYTLAVSGMRLYGLGFLFSGLNIFSAIRLTAYGKGHFSGIITFLRSFALLLLFLLLLPGFFGLNGVWLAVPLAELLTFFVSVWFIRRNPIR
ncbi:MAG: Na+-driven multidrug efflux pump [Clostridiales bacterium]|nr:Na+-driven multidrug efflux pump [Clostridiales bacterium]